MTETLKHKGYHGSIEFSVEDDCLHGRLQGINDIITYEGNSVKEVKAAFKDSVDDYVAFCKETNKEPNKPYSGKVMFRIDPKVHAKAALAAQLKGISLNQWAEEVLKEAAGH
ncbi:MAG TPA: type II toxin-antitoxin system HicB family antitoxin [Aestuariivirga sp.]